MLVYTEKSCKTDQNISPKNIVLNVHNNIPIMHVHNVIPIQVFLQCIYSEIETLRLLLEECSPLEVYAIKRQKRQGCYFFKQKSVGLFSNKRDELIMTPNVIIRITNVLLYDPNSQFIIHRETRALKLLIIHRGTRALKLEIIHKETRALKLEIIHRGNRGLKLELIHRGTKALKLEIMHKGSET